MEKQTCTWHYVGEPHKRKLSFEEFCLKLDVSEECRIGDSMAEDYPQEAEKLWATAGYYYGCLIDDRKPENYHRDTPDNAEVYGEPP